MKIKNWRKKIDAIDTAMLQLLNLRTELALEVGRLKGEQGLSLRVPAREHEILSRMKRLNTGPLAEDSVGKIYQLILDESIRTQERNGSDLLRRFRSEEVGRSERNLPHTDARGIEECVGNRARCDADRTLSRAQLRHVQRV